MGGLDGGGIQLSRSDRLDLRGVLHYEHTNSIDESEGIRDVGP